MNLLGMHDRQGKHIPPTGGWCLDLVELKSNPQPLDYRTLRGDIHWLVRVDWSNHGEGTYSRPEQRELYLDAAIRYIVACKGVYGFILGNEPNHEVEGSFSPGYVAEIFSTVRNAVKRHNSEIRCIVPALAPYHPSNIMVYGKSMFNEIDRLGGADGIAIHAYTRSSNPDDISSTATMDSPLVGQFSGFRTYRDQLSLVPQRLRSTPAFITEFDELLPNGWEDANRGIFRAAVRELKQHNSIPGNQKVLSLVAYRWPSYDKWAIQDKPEVIADFRSAVAEAEIGQFEQNLPVVVAPKPTPSAPVPFKREIEPDAANYGVTVVPFPEDGLKDGDEVWIAEKVERLHSGESEGRRHFYFDTVDENGNRLTGIDIHVVWPTGNHTVTSEAKPGEPYSANYPFTPGRNAFNAMVLGGSASDGVRGAGMGEDTPDGFNAGIHSSIFVKWVRRTFRKQKEPAMPTFTVPPLVHPVADRKYHNITQGFGVNEAYYKRFSVDGVPLKGHNGIDFGTPLNTPVVAVADGRVVEAVSSSEGYGNYVKLSHSWGESLYAHLRAYFVSVGQLVIPGQLIGNSGNSGNSTGPHLHFGLRVSPFNRRDGWGGYINPLPYLSSITPLPEEDRDVLDVIKRAASELGMDWELLASLAWAESSFDAEALGGGLMQIGEATWFDWAGDVNATDIDNPYDNAKVGGRYLKFLLARYDGNLYKALWAYNAGMGNVDKNTIPTITKEYSNKVVHGMDLLKAVLR